MNQSAEVLFKLIRIALGKEGLTPSPSPEGEGSFALPAAVDWKTVIDMSFEQGVAALAVDGLQRIYDRLEVSGERLACLEDLDSPELEDLKYEWFGEVMNCEQDYEAYRQTIAHLAKVYEERGFGMMLLKGFGLSLNYPVPSHRPTGDIDIYNFGQWREADKAIEALGIEIDNSHHHHTVFNFEGQMVENHYDFINVHSHLSNRKIEAAFKAMAEDRTKAVRYTFPDGTGMYLPSADLNALFTLRHCALHFASEEMTLRQLLDWALFVDRHSGEVDWDFFWKQTEMMGMTKFALCMCSIAGQRLGMDEAVFHIPERFAAFASNEAALVERVLEDILHPEFDEASGKGVVRYIWSRSRRWWHNRWKHRLVYSDSLLSTFLVQIWSHLLKPSTLRG